MYRITIFAFDDMDSSASDHIYDSYPFRDPYEGQASSEYGAFPRDFPSYPVASSSNRDPSMKTYNTQRAFMYERNNYSPESGEQQEGRASTNHPRGQQRGYSYEKVYPERRWSTSSSETYGDNAPQPTEYGGGRDRSYDYSENYAHDSRNPQRHSSHPYKTSSSNHNWRRPYVRKYEYTDPKTGEQTKLVAMDSTNRGMDGMAKVFKSPGGIDKFMDDFMRGVRE